ncbi:MAG: IS3 family transposase [Coriobacteriia bacterium]
MHGHSADVLLIPSQLPTVEVLRRPFEFTQYRSLAFGKSLRDSGILASMGETGVPHDNTVTESVMATIKKDCVHRHRFKTRDEARFAIFDYIEGFYNPHRRHSSLGNLSPVEFERRLERRRLQAAAS